LRMIRYYSSSSGLHSILLSLWSSTSLVQAQAIKLTTRTTGSIPLKLRLNLIYKLAGARDLRTLWSRVLPGSCEAHCVKSRSQNWDPTSWKSAHTFSLRRGSIFLGEMIRLGSPD
jgi:hypothetical protein